MTHEGVPPIVIQFMLACYVSPDPEQHVGTKCWDSEAGKDTRKYLLDNHLICTNYMASEKGQAWVDFICQTPLPIHKWVRP